MAVVTIQQSVAALYTAIFNRAPDQAGLNFWTAKITAGDSFAVIAAGFAQHEVFTTGIGALPDADYVNALYTNILGSAGDAAGIAYWTARLAAGESKASVVASFVEGSLTIDLPALLAAGSLSQADYDLALVRQQTLTNKADVGIYFAETLGAASNLNPATVSTSKAGLEADPIYKASQAAIAGVTNTPESIQVAKDAIAVAAGSADPAQALLGQTFTLTAGADAFVGGASADVFNALSINADGDDDSTLTAFDSIDGGAGNDTLNIYTDASDDLNTGSLANVTVKNVETINYLNANGGVTIDASKFVGATAINQTGSAGSVSNLAATTTAGFTNIAIAQLLEVGTVAAAATATIALNNVAEGSALTVSTGAEGVLNSVTVTGIVADTIPNGIVENISLAVITGKDVASVAVNTAVATTLFVANNGSTAVSTVDASASTGSISYVANATVASIKTGTGNDTATLATSLNTTVKAASISTGAGNDTVTVAAVVGAAAAGQTVAVDAGEGSDTINLVIADTAVAYNVAAGAGNDKVVLQTALEAALIKTVGGVVSTSNVKIDGGAGTDTLHVVDNTLSATAYERLATNVTGFETIAFDNAVTAITADKLSQFSTLQFGANGAVTGVAAAQTLVAEANLTATAAGYVAAVADPAAPAVYAGTLNIQATGAGAQQTITANADVVNLTLVGEASYDAETDTLINQAADATLSGDFKTLNAELQSVRDIDEQGAEIADESIAELTVNSSTAETVTVTGAGEAVISGAKLTTIDVSDISAAYGLKDDLTVDTATNLSTTTITANALAQSIHLGGADDTVNVVSTVAAMDTITGFSLVANATDAAVLDASKSDALQFGIANVNFTVATIESGNSTFTLALDQVAKLADANVLFAFGGDTYAYIDSELAGVDTYAAADTLVKLVGTFDLALLEQAQYVA